MTINIDTNSQRLCLKNYQITNRKEKKSGQCCYYQRFNVMTLGLSTYSSLSDFRKTIVHNDLPKCANVVAPLSKRLAVVGFTTTYAISTYHH